MTTILATALRAAPNEGPASAPSAGPTPASNHESSGFASLLRQNQAHAEPAQPAEPTSGAKAAAPKPTSGPAPVPASTAKAQTAAQAPGHPVTTATKPAAPADTDAPPEATTPADARAALLDKLRGAADDVGSACRAASDPGQPSHVDGLAVDVPTTPEPPANSAQAHLPGADAPADPGLLQWIAGLQRSLPPPAEARTDKGSARDPAASSAPDPALAAEAPATRSAELKPVTDTKDKALAAQAAQRAPGAPPDFAALLAERPALDPRRAMPSDASVATVAGLSEGAMAGASAALGASATISAPPAPPVSVVLATPVTAPEFPQALGVQLSVLARDGVQHAELHLNPAEMGPVSVQIVMDGTQARVDFGADLAATRQAIEAGLPELASALRDAGFTLTGGGVSQHARGRGDADEGSDRPRSRRIGAAGTDDVSAAARRVVRRSVAPGGVDLYA